MRVGILVDPVSVANNPNISPMLLSDKKDVRLPIAQWSQQILPTLGYPQTRLVPLALVLPSAVHLQGYPAERVWSRVIEDLQAIVRDFGAWHIEPRDVVRRLRPVIENALHVWALVWRIEESASNADQLLQQLNDRLKGSAGGNVKPCNAPNGIIPHSAPNK